MKTKLSICILILSLSCGMKLQGQHESLGELEWILGNWIRENSFVSENPLHDAPKKIAYTLEGKVMTARVSWEKGGFEAVFQKLE